MSRPPDPNQQVPQGQPSPGGRYYQPGPRPPTGVPQQAGGHPVWMNTAQQPQRGKKTLIAGLIVLGVCLLGGIIAAVVGLGGAVGTLAKSQAFSGSTQVNAEAGEVFQLYALEGAAIPNCEVIGADGTIPGPGTSQTSTIGDNNESWASFDSFLADSTQIYLISCDSSDPVLVGPPLSIGGIFAGVGGILLAVFGGLIGVILIIVGLVKRSRSRTRSDWGYGQPSPGYPPGPATTWSPNR